MADRFRRGSARGSLVRTPRRQTTWAIGPQGTVQRTAAGSVIFALGAQAVDDGLTIVRTRGELLVFLSVATSALDGFTFDFGIGIVSENAFDAGVASIPNPTTDIAWDGWLYHTRNSVKAVVATITEASQAEGSASMRLVVDSKAMRKIKNTDVAVAVLNTETETGSATLNATFRSRMLVKIP